MENCNQNLLITAPLIEGEPAIIYLYDGAMMRYLTVEQYHIVQPKWNGSVLNQPGKGTT